MYIRKAATCNFDIIFLSFEGNRISGVVGRKSRWTADMSNKKSSSLENSALSISFSQVFLCIVQSGTEILECPRILPLSPRVQTHKLYIDEKRETKCFSPDLWSAQCSDSSDCATTPNNKSLRANKVTENMESILFCVLSIGWPSSNSLLHHKIRIAAPSRQETRTAHRNTHKNPPQRQSNTEAACMEVLISPPPRNPGTFLIRCFANVCRHTNAGLQSSKRPHCYWTPVQ